MGEFAISMSGLYKTYGSFVAVDNLTLTVQKNHCFGLLGPNGAGKTTTMKMMYGKSLPDKREETHIEVMGYPLPTDALYVRSIAGVVPQTDNLDLELNITDNLLTYARFYGINRKIAMQRIEELLTFMELKERAKSSVRELSGGMQRRLTIARALIHDPKILFLDEPTTGLDPQVRHLIWNKLRALKNQGVTLCLTTHYMEEAYQICDEIVIMDKGKKVLSGNPRRLLEENLEGYVLEIYPQQTEGQHLETHLKSEMLRFERFNDILFVFSNDLEKISNLSIGIDVSKRLLRQSNLEDLFLKVTGRRLNEEQ